MKQSERHRKQLGVALISALVVVALATTAAVSLSSSLQLSLRRSGNLIARDQAWQYLLGGEQYALIMLQRDRQNSETDHLKEAWAQPLPPLPVEGGSILAKVTDLQSRININAIIDEEGNQIPAAIERLRNLFTALEIQQERVDALVDWIDNNNEVTGSYGAESDFYFGQDVPYRAANTPMESPGEVLLLRDMKPEEGKKLINEIAALPAGTSININTATDATLIALGIGASSLETLKTSRPFENIDDFKALNLIENDNLTGLDVKTHFFLLEITAKIGRARLRLYSIIYRTNDNKSTVISRSLSTL